jgi:hypothetical protein
MSGIALENVEAGNPSDCGIACLKNPKNILEKGLPL